MVSKKHSMASSEFEANEYDLGTTSVRLLRVGNVIQMVFSNKIDARFYFSEAASKFKRLQDEWRDDRL